MDETTKKSHRPRGTGSLFRVRQSSKWYCQYYLHGVPQKESTGTSDKNKAQAFLQKRLAQVSTGNFLGPKIDRIKVSEIVEDVLASHKERGLSIYSWQKSQYDHHLKPHLGHLRCSQITTHVLAQYKAKRKAEPIPYTKTVNGNTTRYDSDKFPSNATINRELALLRAAFHYARKSTPPKVTWVPHFDLLPENSPRQGFLPDDKVAALRAECSKVGVWLRALFEIFFTYGWRRDEPLELLTVGQCDFLHRQIVIHPGVTKGGEGRTVPMTQQIFELLKVMCEDKQPTDKVFTRKREDGTLAPIVCFRTQWKSVCKAAGVEGLRVHDLRRTGARNLRRMGVHESVIMKIGGWKTRSMFDRYNIVDDQDVRQAIQVLERNDPTTFRSDSTSTLPPKSQQKARKRAVLNVQ